MLVIAIMAVVSALVLPKMFHPVTADLGNTARHLTRVLRLAAEEAQLRGAPLRWNAWADHYDFQLANQDGEWQAFGETPFAEAFLPDGVRILELKLADAPALFGEGDARSGLAPARDKKDEARDAPLGFVEFMADGMLSAGDVVLGGKAGERVIELRPGAAGIRVRGK